MTKWATIDDAPEGWHDAVGVSLHRGRDAQAREYLDVVYRLIASGVQAQGRWYISDDDTAAAESVMRRLVDSGCKPHSFSGFGTREVQVRIRHRPGAARTFINVADARVPQTLPHAPTPDEERAFFARWARYAPAVPVANADVPF